MRMNTFLAPQNEANSVPTEKAKTITLHQELDDEMMYLLNVKNTRVVPLALQKPMQIDAKYVAICSKIATHFARLLSENSAANGTQILMQIATQNAMQIETKIRGFLCPVSI